MPAQVLADLRLEAGPPRGRRIAGHGTARYPCRVQVKVGGRADQRHERLHARDLGPPRTGRHSLMLSARAVRETRRLPAHIDVSKQNIWKMLSSLIFDMDGTLSNSDPVHMQAFRDYLEPEGILVDDDFYRTKISGRTNAAIFSELFPDRPEREIERRADEKEAMFRRLSATLGRLRGLDTFLDLAARHRLRLAVVTNGPRVNLDHMVEQLGLAGRFEVHLAREDVAQGKPDPLPYRTALERLGVPAAEAVAFEDSPAGVMAAKGAGLFTYGLLTGHDGEALARAGADRLIRDFADPVLWRDLEARLGPG